MNQIKKKLLKLGQDHYHQSVFGLIDDYVVPLLHGT